MGGGTAPTKPEKPVTSGALFCLRNNSYFPKMSRPCAMRPSFPEFPHRTYCGFDAGDRYPETPLSPFQSLLGQHPADKALNESVIRRSHSSIKVCLHQNVCIFLLPSWSRPSMFRFYFTEKNPAGKQAKSNSIYQFSINSTWIPPTRQGTQNKMVPPIAEAASQRQHNHNKAFSPTEPAMPMEPVEDRCQRH